MKGLCNMRNVSGAEQRINCRSDFIFYEHKLSTYWGGEDGRKTFDIYRRQFFTIVFFLPTGSSISLLTFSSCSSRFVRCPLNHFPLSQIAPCWNIGLTAVFFFHLPLLPQRTHLHLCTQQLITGWRWPCKLEGAKVALIMAPDS